METKEVCFYSKETGLYYKPDGTPFQRATPKEGAFKPKVDERRLLSHVMADMFFEGRITSPGATEDNPLAQEPPDEDRKRWIASWQDTEEVIYPSMGPGYNAR